MRKHPLPRGVLRRPVVGIFAPAPDGILIFKEGQRYQLAGIRQTLESFDRDEPLQLVEPAPGKQDRYLATAASTR